MQTTVKLGESTLNQFKQILASIQHWSNQHTRASIEVANLLQTVATLYDAKKALLDKAISDGGVDTTKVQQIHVNEDGSLAVTIGDDA